MKNKLEAELKDLANKISQTNFEDANSLKRSARELYEKLTILSFTEENLQGSFTAEPQFESSGQENRNGSHPKAEDYTASQSREEETSQNFDDYLPDGTQYNDSGITEPNTEKIKDIVAHMAPETQKMDHMINHIITREETPKKEEPSQSQDTPQAKEPTKEQDVPERKEPTLKEESSQEQKTPENQESTHKQVPSQASQPAREQETPAKQELSREQEPPAKQESVQKQEPSREQETPAQKEKDFRDIGVDYDNLPAFEPVQKQEKEQRPRSLNDRLKNGLNIGLNERLAFIRHLFEGKTSDYNRVISQLNTFDTVEDAKTFIQQVVKPDYKNWAGKEEYEERFMYLVENKFSK